ncbi:MAG: YggS family pyridoxal phosphate-dependent enzyme [Bacteroidetes bacterium]|nr:YggS family pyridoxal phosphate-dependent enzyme [Bacteroidota bacterium]MBU2584687.1 YggS family pyridoxal phosphate-dependent enzyme [Bacteroidota bacterium]
MCRLLNTLKENIEIVKAKIDKACEKAGRKSDEIKLIAVSKTVPSEDINQAVEFGILDFGENKVQEFMNKFEHVNSAARFHMIGHLQTNKVKYIFDKVSSIQSIDSIKLANEVNKRAAAKSMKINGLIQIHTAKEETKFGLDESEFEIFMNSISDFKNIYFNGLMTIGTFTEDEKEIRRCFTMLRNLKEKYSSFKTDNCELKELSMGMTSDYEIAIEEGSTILRIGTAIFGTRGIEN